jgi:hypothetical protein
MKIENGTRTLKTRQARWCHVTFSFYRVEQGNVMVSEVV